MPKCCRESMQAVAYLVLDCKCAVKTVVYDMHPGICEL